MSNPKDLSDNAVIIRALVERTRTLEHDLSEALNQRDDLARELESVTALYEKAREEIALRMLGEKIQ